MNKKMNGYLRVGLILTGFLAALILLGMFWTPYDPQAMSVGPKLAAPSLRHLMLQCGGDVGLSHYLGKRLGPPFAVQGLIHPAASFLEKRKKSPPHAAAEPAPSRHMAIPLNAARFPA